MTGPSELWAGRELDPLSAASLGTALAGAMSLVWPELVAGTVSLAAVASFVVWVRAVRVLRKRRETGYRPARLIPFLVIGGSGWTGALLIGPEFPPARVLLLGAVALGFWVLSRSSWVAF
jgi:hypothetical protein